jgi:folate-binding protein YgfZ
VAHAWVAFSADPPLAWLLSDPGARETLGPHLERFRVMEDVEIRGPEGTPRLLGVAGPERGPLADAIVTTIPGSSAIHAEPLSFVLAPPVLDPSALPPFVDPRAFEAWRIRWGIPYQGVDFNAERIATELSMPEAISMTKGCYVGQEVVARTSNRGKVRRLRIGFRFPCRGEAIPAAVELRSGGMEAGHVTSAVWEPGTREGVGMGYLTSEALTANLDVLAVQGEKTTHLSLHSWPL